MTNTQPLVMETWRPVSGYEGMYEVSDQGRIRTVSRRLIRSNGRPHTVPARVLREHGGGSDKRHMKVRLHRGDEFNTHEVAHLVLTSFVGPRPAGLQCCHSDGNATNNRLANLRWDTLSGNTLDSVRHGTHNQARKTHCPQGHPYDAENTLHKNGRRHCRECNRIYCRRYQRRRTVA